MHPRRHRPAQKQANSRQSGFGLVELITAIAILAIVGTIALPAVASLSDKANERRCKRIAQEFAILANNAVAAGNSELTEVSSVAQAIELLCKGVRGSDVFADSWFRLPNVKLADRTQAAHHLSIDKGRIIFDPRHLDNR